MAEAPICPVCRRPADDSGRASCRCADVEVLPRPVTQPDQGPDPADLAMFPEGARRAGDDTSPLPAVGGRRRPRRRVGRGMALAVGGTALAVVGSGVLVAGLLTRGDDPFDEARFDHRGGAPTAVVPTDGDNGESAEASPDGSASPSPSPSPSSSATASPSPSPSRSVPPSASPGTSSASAPTSASPSSTLPGGGGPDDWGDRDDDGDGGDQSRVLRQGDDGPEVAELQYRLLQTYAYRGEVDGRYDREVRDGVARFQEWYGVRGDPRGVYGPHTRRALEGATRGPGRR